MTFTVKIALQPFEVAFEAGSIAEAVAILQEPDNELAKLAALATGGEEEVTPTTAAPAPEKAKRGRKSKTAVEAVAPAPIPVPDAAPPAPPVPAPAPVTGNDPGPIPPFLDRNAAPVAVAPPPPPAPPAAPVSPPAGVLAAKVAAELHRRGDGAADQGKGLVDWLAGAGLCVPGASFQEACDCVMFLSDEKLGPVATALGISG